MFKNATNKPAFQRSQRPERCLTPNRHNICPHVRPGHVSSSSLHDLQSCFLSVRNVPPSRGMWPIVTFNFVYKTQLKQNVLSNRQMMDERISLSEAVYIKFLAPVTHKSFLTCFFVVYRVCFFCRTRTLISFKFNSIWKVLFCKNCSLWCFYSAPLRRQPVT